MARYNIYLQLLHAFIAQRVQIYVHSALQGSICKIWYKFFFKKVTTCHIYMLVHLPFAQRVKSLANLAVECFICEFWSNLQFNITVFLFEPNCHMGIYEHVPIVYIRREIIWACFALWSSISKILSNFLFQHFGDGMLLHIFIAQRVQIISVSFYKALFRRSSSTSYLAN